MSSYATERRKRADKLATATKVAKAKLVAALEKLVTNVPFEVTDNGDAKIDGILVMISCEASYRGGRAYSPNATGLLYFTVSAGPNNRKTWLEGRKNGFDFKKLAQRVVDLGTAEAASQARAAIEQRDREAHREFAKNLVKEFGFKHGIIATDSYGGVTFKFHFDDDDKAWNFLHDIEEAGALSEFIQPAADKR